VSTVSGLLRAVLERPVNDSIRSRNEIRCDYALQQRWQLSGERRQHRLIIVGAGYSFRIDGLFRRGG